MHLEKDGLKDRIKRGILFRWRNEPGSCGNNRQAGERGNVGGLKMEIVIFLLQN